MYSNLIRAFRQSSASAKAVAFAEIVAFAMVAFIMMVPDQARAQSGNVYGSSQAQVYSATEEAVVLQVMQKAAEPSWQTRTAGAGVGAALGGALGRQSSNSQLGGLIGGLLGGIAGERLTNAVATASAQEIVLQVFGRAGMPPRIISVIQPAPYDRLVAGEQVFLINTAGTWRVVKKLNMPVAFNR